MGVKVGKQEIRKGKPERLKGLDPTPTLRLCMPSDRCDVVEVAASVVCGSCSEEGL